LNLPACLDDWLRHLENLRPGGQAGIELGLARMQQMGDALGQTQRIPVITVGGTNGKGSTCAYLETMLCFSGHRVGCYTSPHLFTYNERIRINREPVSDAMLCAAMARVETVRQALGGVALTYFEFGTLAAWEIFTTAGVEVAVLEVGLGGRLDAVNYYDADLSIVTSVDLDHTDWLGETREDIGYEKAGIFRAGRPALCADPVPPQRLLEHAQTLGADLRLIGRDFGYCRDAENRQQWHWWCRSGEETRRRTLAYPVLRGGVQLQNATVALAALDTLAERLPVPMQAIRRGLLETELPARFQVLPGRPAVILDVAHNPQAVRKMVDNLAEMGFFERTYAVVGMLADKDAAAALIALKGKVDAWFVATLDGARGQSAERLAGTIRQLALGGEVNCFDSPAQAMRAAQGRAGESDRILAFGSFHTVAGALQTLKNGR